jgi:HEPN domain-containing protein
MKNGNCFDWLNFAQEDYDVCKELLQHKERYAGIVAYHAQQSAEKAFKCYLKKCEKNIPKTHNLNYLMTECFFIDATFAELQKSAIILNPYSVQTRYPDELNIALTHAEAVELVGHAEKILNFVTKKLN